MMFTDPHTAALHRNAELRRQLDTRRLEAENERLARELAEARPARVLNWFDTRGPNGNRNVTP